MRRFFVILALVSIGFSLSAPAAVFTSDMTISPANTNFDGDDIEVIGCTVTIDGPHSFSDMFVIANGTINHSPATNSADTGLTLTISNYLVIEFGSEIVADGLGYAPGNGPGVQSVTNSIPFGLPLASGGGGGYGGTGGASVGGARGGDAYGSLQNPTNAGSGGGSGVGAATGGAGGGIVKLKIGGALVLDGRISADGGAGTNDASGGGSGGSISIICPMASGTGTISANGGRGESSSGGGGGGGRILVVFTNNDFVGSISAHGGDGAIAGGAGTIYSTGAKSANNLILIDNGGLSGTNTPINTPPYANMTIQGGAVAKFGIPPNNLLNLVIGSNSWITGFSVFIGVSIQANNITVGSGGGFDFNGISAVQPGPGLGGSSQIGGGNYGGGGGHGGPGGNGFAGAGGVTFDSATAPIGLGGNGGRGEEFFSGNIGNGGGGGGNTLKITASQNLEINGFITANGQNGLTQNSGGGAGGSIQLLASNFTGHGFISANGGNAGSADGGGGGGGRIAISFKTNTFSGTLAAHGGIGYQNGGPGTIYVNAGPAIPPQLTIDNAGLEAPPTLLPLGQGNALLTNAASAVLTENLQMQNLYISSNCYLICSNLNTIFAKQLVIETNGGIIADAVSTNRSLPESGATLTNTNGINSGGGGACAGFGGNSALGAAGGSPVFLSQPEDLATGAGGGGGGAGGGFLQLNVEGSALINGRISANGGAGKVVGSGGGGGGFMILTVNSLTGNGVISANGGEGQLPLGGGGGGGQVNLTISNSNLFAGIITAFGGEGASIGGAGIVGLRTNQSVAQIKLDNNGRAGTNTVLIEEFGGLYDVNVLNGAIADGPGAGSDLRNLFVGSNATVMIPTHYPLLELELLGNLTVQAGGVISSDGMGGAPSIGRAPGGAGGSHGGLGGSGAGGPTTPANSESVMVPALPGLGGQYSPGIPPAGGRGSGPLLISCGILKLDGTITANGQAGISEGCGGGAGGSISIHATAFSGKGSIDANGGDGNFPEAGGGGGGRIAIQTTATNSFTGKISAVGGRGFNPGGAGTIFTEAGAAQGTLVIDNSGTSNGYTKFPQIGNFNVVLTGNADVLAPNIISTGSLLLLSNSFLIATSTLPTLTIEATGNVTISAGSGISCDAVSSVQNGLGGFSTILPNGGRTGGGGANGGNGGMGAGGAAGGIAPLESIIQPGSGGGPGGFGLLSEDHALPALGGGAVYLGVKGTLQVDGLITANGADATNEWGGGGAGGSVSINAINIAGTGTITANGGSGSLPNGGGGGGGRVALSVETNSFAGLVSAYGSEGFVAGGAGTVYVNVEGTPGLPPKLIIDNGGLLGAATPLYESVPTTVDLIVTNGAIVQPRASLSLGGLSVESNAFITQLSNHFAINVSGNAQVGPTAAISADGGGWSADSGPGAGTTASNYTSSGGGYGGAGGLSEGGALSGETNGFMEAPTNWGSGGGIWFGPVAFSQGGGAISLTVGGTLTVNGDISANGNNGVYPGSGGGAGGSIWLTVGALAGNGLINADGGASQDALGGGGGGGRIAVYSSSNSFVGSITANGGSGFGLGGVGSIFISINKTVTQVEGTLIPGLAISQPISPASLTLSWIGKTGSLYQVQSSDDLIHWRPFGDVVLSGTGSTQTTLTPVPNSQQQYFRLAIVH